MNKTVQNKIIRLVNKLPVLYPDLSFQNHCYRRIAYDNVSKTKWNNIYPKLYIQNCTETKKQLVYRKLEKYAKDKSFLLQENKNSLNYRK